MRTPHFLFFPQTLEILEILPLYFLRPLADQEIRPKFLFNT